MLNIELFYCENEQQEPVLVVYYVDHIAYAENPLCEYHNWGDGINFPIRILPYSFNKLTLVEPNELHKIKVQNFLASSFGKFDGPAQFWYNSVDVFEYLQANYTYTYPKRPNS